MTLSDRLSQLGLASGPAVERRGVPRRSARHEDPFGPLKRSVHEALLEVLGPKLYDTHLDERELEQQVTQALQVVLQRDETPMTVADRARVAQEVADDILGHGPLEPYLRDPDVSEIMVNGHDQIYVERNGRLHPVGASFADEAHLRRTIEKIVARVGRRVDESSPMVDARLPDGSRVNAVVPPVALDGSLLTIRKFAVEPLTMGHLIRFGTMTPQVADLLRLCVQGRLNIVIGGGTGSGKTTTLNVLSAFVPEDERIVTIEDAAELQLRQDHVLRLESRPANLEKRGEITIRDLVRNALRMRPDRIIIGEVRDAATLDMLQAMNTGHDGSITTIHSNSPRDTLSRMETMVMMANVELTQRAIREQMASAIDLIVHQSRLKDGSRRITHITEVQGMEGEVVVLQDVFMFDFHAGTDERGSLRGVLRPTGPAPDVPEPPGRPRCPGTAGNLPAAGLRRMSAVSWSLAAGLGAIFAALFILAVTVFGSLARAGQQRDLAGRIASYGPRHGASPANDDPGAARKAGSVALDVTKRLMSPAAEQRLSGRLELAASCAQAHRVGIARRMRGRCHRGCTQPRHRQRHHRCPGGSTGRLAQHADVC